MGPLNQTRAAFALEDVLELERRYIMLSLNCHAIGTITEVDLVNHKVSATVNYTRTVYTNDANGIPQVSFPNYAMLVDMPFIILGGGKFSMTFPIAPNDQCMILFNDRDIDNWISSGQVAQSGSPPATNRLHSFSDGIALVGFSKPTLDPTRAKFGTDDTYVAVSETKIKLANAITTLNTQLQNLITHLKALSIDVSSVGPGGGTVSAASQATLTADATALGGLLE